MECHLPPPTRPGLCVTSLTREETHTRISRERDGHTHMDSSDQVVSGRCPSELCLVLVGSISCGKTMTADTLLGQRSAPGPSASSRVSQIRSGLSAGRRLTVVETPRWYWRGQEVEAHIQEETLRFLGSSAPGPFVLLILIPIGEFTEVERRIPDQLERMFGPSVLAHALVLLTCGEFLMGRGLDQYLGKEAGLQELVRRCHGRCHVIMNRRPDDRQQVLALLEKVEQMMQRNGGFHLETHGRDVRAKQTQINTLEETGSDVMTERRLINGLQCEETDARHTPLEENPSFKLRAHHSSNKVWDGSDSLDSSDPLDDSSLPELRLVLLGRCGSGKSAAGNIILGREEFDLTADSQRCVKTRALVEDTRVSVVDTPDWFQSERSSEEVKAQISSCVALLAPGPHAFLLCVPVDRPAHSELSALSTLEKTLGPDAVRRHTMVIFTRAELLPDAAEVEQVEEYIASRRPEMLELVQRCGDRYHVLQSGGAKELLEKVQQTVRESGADFYSTSLFQQKQIPTVRRDRERLNPSRALDALKEEEEEVTSTARSECLDSAPLCSVPKLLAAGALMGAALGVFLAGAVGGAVGAVLGSVLAEVGRQRLNKHKTE
uniref:AIG1-type G domain-containing protein n=1 Tax=Cyprinus carpio carpio TaxID=630221 RepID=A0A8C1D546_CYPCA